MKSRARLYIGLIIFAAVSVSAQTVEESATRSRLLALEHAWNQAEGTKDLRALDNLFDNSLVYVDADGALLTKAEFLNRLKTAQLQQVDTDSMTVEVFDQTAIVTGSYRISSFKDGKVVVRRGRFIDTWMFKGQTWVCIAAQATPILR